MNETVFGLTDFDVVDILKAHISKSKVPLFVKYMDNLNTNLEIANNLCFKTLSDEPNFPKAKTMENHYKKIVKLLKKDPRTRSREDINNLIFFFQDQLMDIIFSETKNKYSD